MKKVIRLTESDLTRIVKKVISEQNNSVEPSSTEEITLQICGDIDWSKSANNPMGGGEISMGTFEIKMKVANIYPGVERNPLDNVAVLYKDGRPYCRLK